MGTIFTWGDWGTVASKAFRDEETKEKSLEKGRRCTLGRNKYTKIVRGKREKKTNVSIGISGSHRILLPKKHESHAIKPATYVEKSSYRRRRDAAEYRVRSFLVAHR